MVPVTDLHVVLASASPRRRDLLDLIGIRHTVSPADVDESLRLGELPEAYVERLAREKAETLAATNAGSLIIGADTTVVVDDIVLAKPEDTGDAERMLGMLSGRSHTVLTAVAVNYQGKTVSAVE
ncbi:MAG TPA: Maf family protein, partial [Gemmatimonadaceae bacterium]|nr:Maf family protein [Gemmatimonadaceae bacterium]